MHVARIQEHFQELRGHLAGKDPRRLSTEVRGRALVMLTDEHGALHRLTIHLTPKTVKVVEQGASPNEGESFAVIKATADAWLDFYGNATPDALGRLSLYGDMELVAAVGELFSQTRSLWDLRAGK